MNFKFSRRLAGDRQEMIALATCDIAGRLFAMLAWIIIARELGDAGFGLVSWCLAIVAYASIAADGGLAAFGTRELARNSSTEDARAVQRLRLCLSAAVFTFVVVVGWYLLDHERWVVLVCTAAWLLPMSLNPEWLLQGQQRMAAIGALRLGIGLALLGATIAWSLWPRVGPATASVLRAVGEACVVSVAFTLGWTRTRTPTYAAQPTVALLRGSFPLAGASMLTALYAANFDTLVLGYSRSHAEAGLYAAAFRVYLMTAVLPKLLLVQAYPRFAASASDPKALQFEINRFVARLLRYGLPGVVICGLLATELITLLFGSTYAPAATVLQWLMAAAVALLLNAPFPSALIATGNTRAVLLAFAAALLVSVSVNLVATPRWGMPAAAIAVILAETTVLLVTLYQCRRKLNVRLRKSTGIPALDSIAAAIAGFVARNACLAEGVSDLATVAVVVVCAGLAWAVTGWLLRRGALS